MKTMRLFLLAAVLAAAPLVRADNRHGYCLDLNTARPVPKPTSSSQFNSLVSENSGAYMAVWDDTNAAIIERRDVLGNQVWLRTFETGENGETTRVFLTSPTRTLWCSNARWVFLDNATGQTLKTELWELPQLDANKVVIIDDVLHVINGATATQYDTNMNVIGACAVTPPGGFWRGFDDNWLVNVGDSGTASLGVARLQNGLEVGSTLTIALGTTIEGGYAEHRVLGQNDSSMAVVTTVNTLTNSQFISSYFATDGSLLTQTRMEIDMVVTGSAVLEEGGWLLSGMSLVAKDPPYFSLRLSATGVPRHLYALGPGMAQRYIVLNTVPPRCLRVINPESFEIYEMVRANGGRNMSYFNSDYVYTGFDWEEGWSSFQPSREHFWLTPTTLNVSPASGGGGGTDPGGTTTTSSGTSAN